MTDLRGRSLAIYLPDLSGGGAERLQINLTPAFQSAGLNVSFLLDRKRGELLDRVPAGAHVDVLDATRQLKAFPRLVRHLRQTKPDFLLSSMGHNNIMSIWAGLLAGAHTHVVVSLHNTLSMERLRGPKYAALPWLYRYSLPRADGIVAVSEGVADDICQLTGCPRQKMNVIYNGVVNDAFNARAQQPSGHPFFALGVPVFVSVGRMVEQKDFATLIAAFAQLVQQRDARLIILGDGPLRGELVAMAEAAGVSNKLDMPGFHENPLSFMREADALVMSSRFEGFGIVIAEALACGTPVVSTDCQHGPNEILENGHYGALVPVGDPQAMRQAMLTILETHPSAEELIRRGNEFSVERCAGKYLDLFRKLLRQ